MRPFRSVLETMSSSSAKRLSMPVGVTTVLATGRSPNPRVDAPVDAPAVKRDSEPSGRNGSERAYLGQEVLDTRPERFGIGRKLLRRSQNISSHASGLARSVGDASD